MLLLASIIAGSSTYGMTISGIVLTGWLLLLGISTDKLVPSEYKFSTSWFIFRILFAALYIIIIDSLFGSQMPKLAYPFHIVATLFLFSCMWTCAKSIVLAETQRKQNFNRYIGTFLLLWFFPIGIWFVQPRLNRLIEAKTFT